MNIIAPLFFCIIIAIGGIIYYRSRNHVPLSVLLSENGFKRQAETTKEARRFVNALLDPFSIRAVFQGTGIEGWKTNTWLIRLDPGGEEPHKFLLT